MAKKTKEQIFDYVRGKKGMGVTTYFRQGKEYVGFYEMGTGHFKGRIERSGLSERAVKSISGVKVKIKVKFKGERKRQTITYNVYNKKQSKEILFRMNSRLRQPSERNKYNKYGFEVKPYKEDAVPFIKGKKKVDMLFDKGKYEFKDVKIEKYEGVSP